MEFSKFSIGAIVVNLLIGIIAGISLFLMKDWEKRGIVLDILSVVLLINFIIATVYIFLADHTIRNDVSLHPIHHMLSWAIAIIVLVIAGLIIAFIGGFLLTDGTDLALIYSVGKKSAIAIGFFIFSLLLSVLIVAISVYARIKITEISSNQKAISYLDTGVVIVASSLVGVGSVIICYLIAKMIGKHKQSEEAEAAVVTPPTPQ